MTPELCVVLVSDCEGQTHRRADGLDMHPTAWRGHLTLRGCSARVVLLPFLLWHSLLGRSSLTKDMIVEVPWFPGLTHPEFPEYLQLQGLEDSPHVPLNKEELLEHPLILGTPARQGDANRGHSYLCGSLTPTKSGPWQMWVPAFT